MENIVAEVTPSKIDTAKVGARTVLTPRESLTYQNCQELAARFSECVEQRITDVILDCKAVSFLDSEALELLAQIHEELESRGSTFRIIGLNDICLDIFRATRLINVFHLYEDIHEAIRNGL